MPKHKTKKYILLNNLGSKQTLLIEFDQFMSLYKGKKIVKNFCKNALFLALLCLQRIKYNLHWKMNF